MNLLIIIPAYNEEECIKNTVEKIKADAPWADYVIINDCSRDRTAAICEENGFNYVNLPINLGIGGAVQTGYIYGYENGYDLAVQVDADGQHNPAFLKDMKDRLEKGDVDMVIGSRFINKEGFQSSAARRVGIRFFQGLIKLLTGVTITDATSGLRMVNRKIMGIFASEYPRDYPEPETTTAVINHGLKVVEIPVVMEERQGGRSSISPLKGVYYMLKVSMAIIFECIRRH